MSERRLYLVCGLPGAGKTTRVRQLVQATGALPLYADEWVTALRQCVSVVIEFGSWSRTERERIRQAAQHEGATTELHFLNAPLDELVRRVRQRGGPEAEVLAARVLRQESGKLEQPAAEEIARFDRYVGPDTAGST